ncbi:MAG TPA: hypothetical protein VK783_03685 [Bacteroidia bacterium]|jgi:hypothetical protein|nr:hypothetical protein [Bacteroidia bacterium]
MKNRILVFIVGLIAGVVLGVVFDVGIKALYHQVRELHLSLNKINSQQDKISQRLDSIQGKLKDDRKASPLTINKAPFKAPALVQNMVAKHDSAMPKEKDNDSASDQIDSTVIIQSHDSNIVVMTNQLVSVKTVPLKNIDSLMVNKSTERSDSMIASMSNIDDEKDPAYYRVEFWQSPLNFKGYKMSKGKIVLYGVNSTTPFRLIKWDDSYYLLSNQNVFKVTYTDDYKPFEKVIDKTVLKKITL